MRGVHKPHGKLLMIILPLCRRQRETLIVLNPRWHNMCTFTTMRGVRGIMH